MPSKSAREGIPFILGIIISLSAALECLPVIAIIRTRYTLKKRIVYFFKKRVTVIEQRNMIFAGHQRASLYCNLFHSTCYFGIPNFKSLYRSLKGSYVIRFISSSHSAGISLRDWSTHLLSHSSSYRFLFRFSSCAGTPSQTLGVVSVVKFNGLCCPIEVFS